MNISWQWLNELVDVKDITPEYLAERLTLASFEVESIKQNIYKDTILDVSTTANRADTLSMVGIAKEIASILKKPYKQPVHRFGLNIKHKNIAWKNNHCNHHIYTVISNVKITSSPRWLQARLINHDIQPQNNILDILNFISLKWGQHIEVHDLDKIMLKNVDDIDLKLISDKQSCVLINRQGKSIITKDQILTTTRNNGTTLTLAGFSSNINSQIDTNTTHILIQSTVCNIKYIKKLSKVLDLVTPESELQQKGINEADLLNGYNEAILLLTSLTEGIHKKTIYESKTKRIYSPIYIDQHNIDDILGPEVNKFALKEKNPINLDIIFTILNNLFLITYKFNDYLQVNIPLSRINDINRRIDILEEIIRIYGFDQFIDQIPVPINHTYGTKQLPQYTLSHIRSTLRSMGMHETMHSSLVNNNQIHLKIYNPLTEEFNNLKDNLMCGLLESHIYNIYQGNEAIEMFETGRIFTKNESTKYNESVHIAGLIGGQSSSRQTWSDLPIHLSWFQAKGQIEEFFERMNLKITWQSIDTRWSLYNVTCQFFHPKYIAMIYAQGKPIGIFGEINYNFTKNNNCKIYGFELIINSLLSKDIKVNIFNKYSKYPSIIRDINIKTNSQTAYKNLLDKIDIYNDPLIESIKLFDVYPFGKNEQNISLRITYRSQDNTLTNTEIEEVENKLKKYI